MNEVTVTNAAEEMAGYAIMETDPKEVAEIIKTNTGGQLTEFDLDRIKVPSGGAIQFVVPSLTGDEYVKEIECVIVHMTKPRGYWKVGFDESGGGTPPDCSSPDGVAGQGTPGGSCVECPLAQFGSDSKGRGQACKQMNCLYILRKDDILPTIVVAPPTSLAGVRKYMLRLANKRAPFYGVLTKLTLKENKNADGIKYAEIVCTAAGAVSAEQIAKLKVFNSFMASTVQTLQLDSGDFHATGESALAD